MKLKASYLLLLLTLLFSATAFAQVDRRIGVNQYKKDRKVEKKDFVEESVKYLTKELKLDDFQKAAAKTIMEDERDAINTLNEDNDMTTDEKREKASAISTRIYNKILPLLSKEQAVKYTEMEKAKKF